MTKRELIEACNPAQTHTEMALMLGIVERHVAPIDTVLEVGTHQGASAHVFNLAFMRHAGYTPWVISIDQADEQVLPEHREHFTQVVGRSQDFDTAAQVYGMLGDRKVDFLFIDGGHLYHEVKADYEAYAPLVRAGGAIGFHDANVEFPGVEVKKFWQELADSDLLTVLVRDGSDGQGGGTGLVLL